MALLRRRREPPPPYIELERLVRASELRLVPEVTFRTWWTGRAFPLPVAPDARVTEPDFAPQHHTPRFTRRPRA